MSPYRNTPVLTRHAEMSRMGRNVLCAFVAGALTVVLLGEVGKSAAQAAQRAVAEQSVDDGAVMMGEGVEMRAVVHRAPLI